MKRKPLTELEHVRQVQTSSRASVEEQSMHTVTVEQHSDYYKISNILNILRRQELTLERVLDTLLIFKN